MARSALGIDYIGRQPHPQGNQPPLLSSEEGLGGSVLVGMRAFRRLISKLHLQGKHTFYPHLRLCCRLNVSPQTHLIHAMALGGGR